MRKGDLVRLPLTWRALRPMHNGFVVMDADGNRIARVVSPDFCHPITIGSVKKFIADAERTIKRAKGNLHETLRPKHLDTGSE